MTEVEVTIMELFEENPLSYEAISRFFLNMMVESFNDETVPEEFKKAMMAEGIGKERLALIIGGAPRCLFDVFDENGIYIEVYRTNGEAFTFDIADFIDHPGHFIKRKDCEMEAVKEAFKLLEKELQS
jgi:hypothetical protein